MSFQAPLFLLALLAIPLALLALHASRLAFDHPDGGRRVEVEAPLPAELIEFLAPWR